jgi:hypothetical protein
MRQPDINHVTTRATYDAILLDTDGVTALVTISYTHMGNEADRGLTRTKRVIAISTGVLTGAGWTVPWMGSTGGVS